MVQARCLRITEVQFPILDRNGRQVRPSDRVVGHSDQTLQPGCQGSSVHWSPLPFGFVRFPDRDAEVYVRLTKHEVSIAFRLRSLSRPDITQISSEIFELRLHCLSASFAFPTNSRRTDTVT